MSKKNIATPQKPCTLEINHVQTMTVSTQFHASQPEDGIGISHLKNRGLFIQQIFQGFVTSGR